MCVRLHRVAILPHSVVMLLGNDAVAVQRAGWLLMQWQSPSVVVMVLSDDVTNDVSFICRISSHDARVAR